MTLFAAPRISCEVVGARDEETARIFNIQRYSLNDGQGIRTVVFFKGCPHTCPWCANPESISPRIETVRRENKCLRCTPCLRDADECPSGAFERIGRDITLDELEREVLKDDIFFRTSGGGVTLSGGEVLMQAPFATRFLQRLRRWLMACRLALELAPRDPINHSKPRVPSSPNKSCSLCQPNSAWPKPTAICKAAGKLTGMTDKNSQLITRCRRGPNAIPTKCATPPACGK